MHRIKENHLDVQVPTTSLSSDLANISLQYKLLETWRELLVALCSKAYYNIALQNQSLAVLRKGYAKRTIVYAECYEALYVYAYL